ncbi:hypothetical protein D5018_04715 [Parashewanella curva]|uniref:Tetratricopeptide repeat protein n=1 Tax=Parashewanella curva TaxID=2338552 RepID=A0A3L8PZQ1_9GAMM|nr:hypothetical protein [Parashewanella curva]RLV60946.1 hypothetical protein D5018_04715 [Parashewanella curva]
MFKNLLIVLALLSFQLHAVETEQQAKKLLADKQIEMLINDIKDDAPYEVANYKVIAFNRSKEFDTAIEWIDARLQKLPKNNKEARAKEWLLKGNVYANQAMDASIFTAASYASDCLESYQKAHELAPHLLDTKESLIGFYNGAPSFVGGDSEKALALALELEKTHPLEGGRAIFESYKGMDEDEKAQAKLQALLTQYPQDLTLRLAGSRYYFKQERFKDNHALLMESIGIKKPEDEETQAVWYILHYELAKNSIESKLALPKAIEAVQLFQRAPKYVTEYYEQWPKLREAQLTLLSGDKKAAIKLAKQARAASDDNKLRKKAKRIIKRGKV